MRDRMSLYLSLLRPLLFQMDPEKAHDLALKAIAKGLIKVKTSDPAHLKRKVFGVDFPNPVGLGAGFDKNGVALDQWKDLGFGFIEAGTVTRHAQPGNPKPRMFRYPGSKAIINRMGFNNEGADALAARIEKSHPCIPLGINLGKSKITPLEEAAEDYAYSFSRLNDLGDYFVVNVSSPNTPGLRQLQDKDALTKILWRLKEIDGSKPLFVKIAPDLEETQLEEIASLAIDMGLTGLIATNTTLSRQGLPQDPKQDGGLSGSPLTARSQEVLKFIKGLVGDRLVLIGVGGIMNASDAQARLDAGADLVQIYSGWVYGGPAFIEEIKSGLLES